MKFSYEKRNMGITKYSLNALKFALKRRNFTKKTAVILQVNTHLPSHLCGFAVATYEGGEWDVVFTGDGFRTDGSGEGGAGFREADSIIVTEKKKITAVIDAKVMANEPAHLYIEKIISVVENFLLDLDKESVPCH